MGREPWVSQDISFYSEGVKLRGEMFLPADHQPGERRAAWILTSGYVSSYASGGHNVDLCARLAREGYVGLTFDHRGFGRSDGEERLAHPIMWATDIQNAITYLQTRDEVDEMRIGLGGASWGGSVSLYVAAIDDRVAAVFSRTAPEDGAKLLQRMRPLSDWQGFLRELDEDRKQRVLTGKGRTVDAFHVLPVSEEDKKTMAVWIESGNYGGNLQLQTAEATILFKPEKFVHLISPRPVLYLHTPHDKVAGVEGAISMYEKSGEPKTLWLLPPRFYEGPSHYEVTQAKAHPDDPIDLNRVSKWSVVADHVIGWMKENVSNKVIKGTPEYSPPELKSGYSTRLLGESWLRMSCEG